MLPCRIERSASARARAIAIPAKPSKPRKMQPITSTKAISRYQRAPSPTSSSVMVQFASDEEEVAGPEEDSVELSMEEKRKRGGQDVAADKLRSKLIQLQKGPEVDSFKGLKQKDVVAVQRTELENFMSRFPYKTCQRSLTDEIRRQHSLSQPIYIKYEYFPYCQGYTKLINFYP